MASKLLSREEIEGIKTDLGYDHPLIGLCDTALAAHDIYDEAVEAAAQVAEQTVVSKPVWGTQEPATHSKPKTPSLTRLAIAEEIRKLKGQTND